jgi:hypothetical protein
MKKGRRNGTCGRDRLSLLILFSIMAGAFSACHTAGDSLAQPAPVAEAGQYERLRYKLLVLFLPPFDLSLPPGYHEGERLFNGAAVDYEVGRYRPAAEGFWKAARFFQCDEDAPGFETLTANRLAAYKNAVWAWLMADCRKEARRALAEAVRQDPACAVELEKMAGYFTAGD